MSQEDYEIDVMEFGAALRERTAIPGDKFRRLGFQDIRSSGYSVINDGAVALMVESKAVRSYVARFFLKDHLLFDFAKHARDVGEGGAWRHVSGGSVVVAAHSNSSIDVPRPVGHVIATAAMFVHRDYLTDCYGLRVDSLPEQCQDVFRGRPNARFIFDVVLSSQSWMALDAIFRCQMADPLRSIYWRAKLQELLSETVDMLNRCGKGVFGKIESKQARERQLIETAALIYRRDLGSAPSIAELALKLGINRNRLSDGFKDIFGSSPADYAKGIRLDWAKEQLAAGVLSIGEAAYAIGYSNPSAFARAYGEHFGKPPSSDCDLSLTQEAAR